ncbi:type VII toxin-antitoxin system HepT family RNase toxin [Alkalithermobacter paradoxus]
MVKDVIYNKIAIIERCLIRIKEVYDQNPDNLKDYTKQDSIVLNIQRAVEAAIDVAMHIVSARKLGIPQNSRDAFEVLNSNDIIDDDMLKKLKAMIGFRNIAVHNYQNLNIDILRKVIENHLVDFEEFIYAINKLL